MNAVQQPAHDDAGEEPGKETGGQVIDFGRHKGERYTRLPVAYLRWMATTLTGVRQRLAMQELARRGVYIDGGAVNVTNHAVDRASLRILERWRQSHAKNEGLHAWLLRMAGEALASRRQAYCGQEQIVYRGIVFVFEHSPVGSTLITVWTVNGRKGARNGQQAGAVPGEQGERNAANHVAR